MFTNTNRVPALLCAAGATLALSLAPAGTASANSGTAVETARSSSVTSPSCVAQVEAIALREGTNAAGATDLCSGTVTTTETEPRAATAADVASYASAAHLDEATTASLLAAAADGSVMYRDWTHSYWGGSLLEKHAGRTFWDGSEAWIATNRGLTGANVCHSEGGIAVGWSVTPQECTSPGPGGSADALYRFDASVAFEGSPITLDIGLHYSTTATGEVSTWQVGG